ncbi:excise [Mycobacterium phage Hannaconda]|nr:excise [Mycobacterium phage Hannaconda]
MQQHTSNEPFLMTLEDFAREAQVSLATARYWRQVGYGPRYARIGRRVMVQREEAREWLKKQFQEA